jgi:hypothetical protein
VRLPEDGRDRGIADYILGKVRHSPIIPCDLLHDTAHEGGGRIEGPIAPRRFFGGAAAVDFPRVEDKQIARVYPVFRPPEPGEPGTAFGDDDHELLMRVRREGEPDKVRPKQLQAAEGLNPPQSGVVLPVAHMWLFLGIHAISVAAYVKNIQDSPRSPAYD